MFANQNLIGHGQHRQDSARRRRSPELVIERLETRALLTFGNITTVAGDGTAGYKGDGGPATSAYLDYPWDVALDAAGDLYIADSDNNVIREAVATAATTNTGLTSSENPSPFTFALTFTATVSDTSNPGTTPVGTVQFKIDGNDYCAPVALVDGQASIGDDSLAAGAHSIVAIYTPGSSAFVTSTSSLKQTVDPGPTTLNLTAYDGPALDPPPFPFTTSVTAVYGEAVSITANLTPPYGGSPTGQSRFLTVARSPVTFRSPLRRAS